MSIPGSKVEMDTSVLIANTTVKNRLRAVAAPDIVTAGDNMKSVLRPSMQQIKLRRFLRRSKLAL